MENQSKHENTQDKLHEFYAKIQEMEAKAKELRAELDIKIDEQMNDLKEKKGALYTTYQDLKFSSSAAFHDVREGLNKAAEALNEAIKKASNQFKG